MLLFGNPIRTGDFRKDAEDAVIEYKVERIASGYLVTGKIRGKLRTIEVLRTPVSDRLLVNNWESWGPTHVVKRGSNGYAPADIPPHRKHVFSPIPEVSPTTLVSDYFVGMEEQLLGFNASRIAHPYFAVEGEELAGYLEYFDTFQDDFIPLEPLLIVDGRPVEELLSMYADAIANEHRVTINSWNPFGWCSWYYYFDKLTWDDVERNLRIARDEYPFDVFQIDDAYQQDIGDWYSKPEFPPLDSMARAVYEHGFTPGLWTAPFSASETSRLFLQHPDWFVTSLGEPCVNYLGWKKNVYALDTTLDEVKTWLYSTFSSLKRSGFTYHKIDFLFAGAMPGSRNKSVTPIQAYRQGLEIIRKAIGSAFMLGCGAPLLPSVGYVDGMRISEDTAPFWKPELSPYRGANAYHALKNTINRQFMHRKLWHNDPDCIMLRTTNTELTSNIVTMVALVSGLLDNMILQSDDLSIVSGEERKLLDTVLGLRGGTAEVAGLFNEDHFLLTTFKPNELPLTLGVNLSKGNRMIEETVVNAESARFLSGGECQRE